MKAEERAAFEAGLKAMLERNLGNRLTIELANGIYTAVVDLLPAVEAPAPAPTDKPSEA